LLWRKIRSPEEASNTDITTISIICRRAKKLGKQYTKRILPPFVIPYCVICWEAVLEYLCRFPDGALHTEIASEMFGTVDIPTMRRHLHVALTEIKTAALLIIRFIAEIPSLAKVPERKGDEPEWQYLGKTAEEMARASVKVRPGTAVMLPPLVFTPYQEGYKFKVIVTNKLGKAKTILLFHNGRGAQENIFSELKSQCNMNYLESLARAV
jgi:hypothetical protein